MSTRPHRTPSRGYPAPGPQSPGAGQLIGNAYCSGWQQVQAAHYDVIVIGTGPAGVAFIERTLARNPHAAILVLERGGYWLPAHVQTLPAPCAPSPATPPPTLGPAARRWQPTPIWPRPG